MDNFLKAGLKRALPPRSWAALRASSNALERWRLRNDLPRLAEVCGTDKMGVHKYAIHYQRHLAHLKHANFNLLEIGVGGHDAPDVGGASLRMWKAFFPKANIYAIDIFDKSRLEEPRIRIFRGSQADPDFLRRVIAEIGRVDVVIDDGSHVNEHVLASFHTLFPLLSVGGVYAIEDLQTAYWPEFGGNNNPDAPDTSMAMLKRLVDGLNWEEFRDREPGPYDRHITSICFYRNLAFIQKGTNQEDSIKGLKHKVHWDRAETEQSV